MSTRRLLKAAEAIRGVVSMAILTELRDPRVQNVTVVGVEVTPDMREAKVLVSVMGNEAQQRTVLKGLQNSVGFLQSKIADRIETRYIPRLTFVMDEGVKKSVAVQQILEQISKERESNPTSLQIDPPVESSDGFDEQVESETSNDSGGNP
jgi:ribosome-binding factor A